MASINARTIPILLMTLSVLIFPAAIPGAEHFSAALNYAPGLSDFIRTDTSPSTRTIESMPFGLELNALFLFRNDLGVGLRCHWGIVSKVTVKQGSESITTKGWLGTMSLITLTPEFLYAPVRNDQMTVLVGFGPSVTVKTYMSEYGGDAYNVYGGLSLTGAWHYLLTDFFFLNAGLNFEIELLEAWDPQISFFHFQSRLTLGAGCYF